ncbi:MAG: sulfurtransferase TusA family protein [Candidatus Micrarchaeia archaeon]
MTKKVIDARGSACPGPITELAKAYRESQIGDIIELWATDPGVKADAKAWAERTGNEIVSIDEAGGFIKVTLKINKR